MTKRTHGYYWVRRGMTWEIAHYDGVWDMIGLSRSPDKDLNFKDSDFKEIDERIIMRDVDNKFDAQQA